ncbi:hypothetical protein [Weissella confusa]|uniref:hypothetical protein n=1 Tax=Weissella confusa TaxID=1583 RepID=UPI00223B05EE|nr:hypothetical protein [Weissella confusa]
MLNWRKFSVSLAVVLGMTLLAGKAYGSDDVFITDNTHTEMADLGNGYTVTWHTPLYTESREALDKKISQPDVRLEIIREAGFTINDRPAMDWHPVQSTINGQAFDGYLTFKDSRLANVGSTARIAVKFNSVYSIQFQIFYEVSANANHSETWYGSSGTNFTIADGQRPSGPEEPNIPKPDEPTEDITMWPIDAPDFSDWDTQPAFALQTPDTQPADALQKPGYGAVPAPSTPDHGQQTIDGNTEGGRPDTGYIAAPSISGEGDSNVTGPDAPTADNQSDSNDSNGSNGVATSPVATPDGAQTDSVTNGTLGLVSAGVNPIARAAVFGNDAEMLYGNNAASSQQTLNPGSSNGNRTRLGGSNTGRDLIHDMIVSDDAKRSNALKMEQAGVGSEWITMVAGAILGFLFAFFRRRKEEERDEENEA